MAFNCQSYVHLPFVAVVLLLGGFFACYGIAVNVSNIRPPPYWPYVSSTGVEPPERCIFTLILTWGAFIGLATMYLYFKYVLHHCNATKSNLAALIVGVITCFGITLIGSFQWTVAFVPHMIGAFAALIGGFVYSWIVVYISIKHISYTKHRKGIIYCRLIIAIVEALSLVLFVVGYSVFLIKGDEYHNFPSISEWFLIYSEVIFVGTLAFELHEIRGVNDRLELHKATKSEEI